MENNSKERIVVLVDKELKDEFIKACDSRPMGTIVKRLIKDYIKEEEKNNNC